MTERTQEQDGPGVPGALRKILSEPGWRNYGRGAWARDLAAVTFWVYPAECRVVRATDGERVTHDDLTEAFVLSYRIEAALSGGEGAQDG